MELILKYDNKINNSNKTIEKILEDFISNIKSNPNRDKTSKKSKIFRLNGYYK